MLCFYTLADNSAFLNFDDSNHCGSGPGPSDSCTSVSTSHAASRQYPSYIYIQKVSLTQVKNLQEMILTKQKLKDVWCFEDFKVPVESFGWAENALCCQDHLVRLSTCTSRWSIGWIRQRQAEAKRPPKFVLGGRAWREPPKHLIYIYILISHHKDLENIMTMTVLQLSLSAQCHLPIKAVANARCCPRLDKEKPVWPLLWWDEQVSRHLLSFPRAIPSLLHFSFANSQ